MRLLLLLAIGYLAWLGFRKLHAALAAPPPVSRDAKEAVTDLRPCPRCGTFVESQELSEGDCVRCRRP
jgi:uncharacterized paraquat-inducible protein A